ncbi:MAG: PqqD family protein [Lachnospiraceae bacterium]|nr:PqqD family protein [Lachnospiraceae bacterium]
MSKDNKKSDNYMDYIPKHSPKYEWEKDKDGNVTILIENKGFFNRLFQKLLGKPKVSKLHLEKMGSFIWPNIDGYKNIYEIGQEVKEEFKEEAEPLYPRLVKYMKMLYDYGFIEYLD